MRTNVPKEAAVAREAARKHQVIIGGLVSAAPDMTGTRCAWSSGMTELQARDMELSCSCSLGIPCQVTDLLVFAFGVLRTQPLGLLPLPYLGWSRR